MIQTTPPKWGGLPSRCVSLGGCKRIAPLRVIVVVVVVDVVAVEYNTFYIIIMVGADVPRTR